MVSEKLTVEIWVAKELSVMMMVVITANIHCGIEGTSSMLSSFFVLSY